MCPPKSRSSNASRSESSHKSKKSTRSHRSKVDAKPNPWESATTGYTMGAVPADAVGDVLINPKEMTPEQFNAVLVMIQKYWLQKTGRRMTKQELELIRKKLESSEGPITVETLVTTTLDELNERSIDTTVPPQPRTQLEINGGVPVQRPDIEVLKAPCKICKRMIELQCLPFHEALCIKNQPPGAPGYKPRV